MKTCMHDSSLEPLQQLFWLFCPSVCFYLISVGIQTFKLSHISFVFISCFDCVDRKPELKFQCGSSSQWYQPSRSHAFEINITVISTKQATCPLNQHSSDIPTVISTYQATCPLNQPSRTQMNDSNLAGHISEIST